MRLYAAAIALLAVGLHFGAIDNYYYHDDFNWLLAALHSAQDWTRLFDLQPVHMFRPLVKLYFLLMLKLTGVTPWPYHLIGLLLHGVNTWLVYRLADRLLGNQRAALVTSLYFGLLACHWEATYWVSAVGTPFLACWLLSASLVYTDDTLPALRRDLLLVGLALLAFGTKELSALLAPLLLLLGVYRRKIHWRPLLVIGALTAGYVVLQLAIQAENQLVQGGVYRLRWDVLRIIVASYGSFAVPPLLAPSVVSGLSVLVLVAIGLRGGAIERRHYLLLLWPLLTLMPFVMFPSQHGVYSRYTYVPSIGFALWIGAVWNSLSELTPRWRQAVVTLLGLLVLSNAFYVVEIELNKASRRTNRIRVALQKPPPPKSILPPQHYRAWREIKRHYPAL